MFKLLVYEARYLQRTSWPGEVYQSSLRSSLFCTGVLLFYCHIVCLASWFGHGAVDVPS
jgi:hypothetical protein